MSHEITPSDPELTAVESALGSLAPVRSRLDRDRLMFEAGWADHSRLGRRSWQAIAATLALVVAGQTTLLFRQPPTRVVERIVYVKTPVPAPEHAPAVILNPIEVPAVALQRSAELARPPETSYQRLCMQVLRFGLDGLPGPSPSASPAGRVSRMVPESSGAMLQSEMAKLLNPGESS